MAAPPRSAGRRRAILAAVSLVIALALFFSEADPNSWLGRRLGGAPHPFEGRAVMRTPCAGGVVVFLPPAAADGRVLPPLVQLELPGGVGIDGSSIEVYRDADGDLALGEGEALREGRAGWLPRDDGLLEPDGWAVDGGAGEGDLRFHVRLGVGGNALAWQGVVREADADDPRR